MSPEVISPITYTLCFQKWKPPPQKNQRRLYENIKAGILAFFLQILLHYKEGQNRNKCDLLDRDSIIFSFDFRVFYHSKAPLSRPQILKRNAQF